MVNANKNKSLDVDVFKQYKGAPVIFCVSYKEHYTYGNLDDGESCIHIIKPEKFFMYPILNVFTTTDDNSNACKYILSSNENEKVLIPFTYKINSNLSLRRSSTEMENSISHIDLNDNLRINLESIVTTNTHDGILHASGNDIYTHEDALLLQNGPMLEQYKCKYDKDKHVITGDINQLTKNLKPLWD